jgi:misacylated tRNA(Ala) deacylase
MTEELFRKDSYLKECDADVTAVESQAVAVDRTVFYPLGGGQPGDTGSITWPAGNARIIDTRYVVEDGGPLPPVGETVHLELDWDRRYRHMRMHTAMHLLGAVLRYGVTGGNISAEKSRLDFDMEDTVDKEAVAAAMQALVEADHPISCRWINDAELDANPELVRTMSVQPPAAKAKFACSR